MKINLKQTAQECLDSTKRTQYVDKDVVRDAPLHTFKKVDIEFFNLGKYVSCDELEKEYESRDLIPTDIREISSLSESVLDEKKYVGTQWKDKDGKWCFAAFDLWCGGRRVGVSRDDNAWRDRWWFAGVRKSALSISTSELLEPQSLDLASAIKICKEAGLTVTKVY
jgi:hypothetical protein